MAPTLALKLRSVTRSGSDNGTPDGLLANLVEQSLKSGVHARLKVDGRSMLPFIRPGDKVSLGRLDSADPRLGDIVAVRGMSDGGLMLHRVVSLCGGRLTLRGDNTSMDNGEFDRADVLGVVIAVERRGHEVWFGAGHWGRPVAWAVRTGTLARANRVAAFVSRLVCREGSGPDSEPA